MSDLKPCVVCGLKAETFGGPFDGTHQKCAACGEFKIARSAIMPARIAELRPKLRGWISDQGQLGEVPLITLHTLDVVEALALPQAFDRANRILSYASKTNPRVDSLVDRRDLRFLGVSYSQDPAEVNYLFDFLAKEGLLEPSPDIDKYNITPKGCAQAEALRAKGASTTQGFVAMWFDPSMDLAWRHGFFAGIQNARYTPLRVDGVEHVGKIDDEIIAQIRRSRFVVADFTGQRGGVYFEAGYALGLGTPVIWTCRKDELSKLHFDTRQFNTIDWTAPEDLAQRLQRRIEAVIGLGSVIPKA